MPIDNSTLKRQLRAGDISVLRGGGPMACDCGTALGTRRRSARQHELDSGEERLGIERKTDKLRRAGWSAAKIEKWRAQKERAAARRSIKDEEPAIEDWATFLARVLDSGAAQRVGVLLHWYNGSIDGERIVLARRE